MLQRAHITQTDIIYFLLVDLVLVLHVGILDQIKLLHNILGCLVQYKP